MALSAAPAAMAYGDGAAVDPAATRAGPSADAVSRSLSLHRALPFSEQVRFEAGRRLIGVQTTGGFTVTQAAKGERLVLSSDEERVARGAKRARLADAAIVAIVRKVIRLAAAASREAEALNIAVDGSKPVIFTAAQFVQEGMRVALAFEEPEKVAAPFLTSFPSPEVAALITDEIGDPRALSYAGPAPDYGTNGAFSAILKQDRQPKGFVPPVGPGDFDWATNVLPAAAFEEEQQDCLAKAIYFESRGEPVRGQAAVAQVILNRVRNPAFPDTICDVVYQNEELRNRCQFSFACDGIADRVRSARLWDVAREIAKATTSGRIWLEKIGSATHYHALRVNPRWASALRKADRIGRHVFYRTVNGGWS